jgi:hypothetical protein
LSALTLTTTGGKGVTLGVGVTVGGPGVSVGPGVLVGGSGVPVGAGEGVAVTMMTTTVCTPDALEGPTGTKMVSSEPGTMTCGVAGSEVGSSTPGYRVASSVGVATLTPSSTGVQVGRGVRLAVAAPDDPLAICVDPEHAASPPKESRIRNSTPKVRLGIAEILSSGPPQPGVR